MQGVEPFTELGWRVGVNTHPYKLRFQEVTGSGADIYRELVGPLLRTMQVSATSRLLAQTRFQTRPYKFNGCKTLLVCVLEIQLGL